MDLSNGSRSANLRTGSIKPKTGFLAASNYTLEQMEERYICMLRNLFDCLIAPDSQVYTFFHALRNLFDNYVLLL